MDNTNKLQFDETKEMELFFDFHKTQILRINTGNSNIFLAESQKFDDELVKRVDEKGRVRAIYVSDKTPPLSALLSFVQRPLPEVKWGIYAVILRDNATLARKFMPIVLYGMNITGLKNRYSVKIFEEKNRNDFTEIFKWMDSNMVPADEAKIDTGN